MISPSVITIDIDPVIDLGPLGLSWHGLTIALGLLCGGWLATRVARERGLDAERITTLLMIIAISGILGARAFYLIENDPNALLNPEEWFGSQGYSFYGGMLIGIPAVALYLRRAGLTITYLDALAAGFPLGMAVGRIGDVINGEHYGPASDLPWAVRNSHPQADVPSNELAYHSGGLYEVVLALTMFAVIWPLRGRLRQPGSLLCVVVASYALGRFMMFFVRDDSTSLTLGLSVTQWTSVALLGAALAGLAYIYRFRGSKHPGPLG